jgi:cobalt-zinc-cadmium efflux system protein
MESDIQKKLRFAVVFTSGILVTEVIGGIWTGSLALLSDAAHVFMDVFSLGLSLFAIYLASMPVSDTRTYGWHRAEIFAAFINGITLLLVSFVILYEAWGRMISPTEVKSLEMVVIAGLGLVANLIVVLKLKGHGDHDLNLKSAFLHVLGDFLASIGVVTGGLIMYYTGWYMADPIIAGAIGILIMWGSLRVLRDSGHILLEGVPRGVDIKEVAEVMKNVDGVKGVHHLHIWTICSHVLALSSHVLVDSTNHHRGDQIIKNINHLLKDRFNIVDSTLQLDEVGSTKEALVQELTHDEHAGEHHHHH